MKKEIIIFALSVFAFTAKAQTDFNPFESIGKKGTMLTLSNGKYIEIGMYDSLQRIGSVIVNVNTGKIYEFLPIDTVYSEATLDPTVISRWYSIDPLASKYPSLSPYAFTNNNPIWFKEVDGRYFDFSNLTAEQKEQYDAQIKVLRASKMFDYVYKQLEASNSAFVVKFEQTSGTNPAEFRPNSDGHGGDIVYSPNSTQSNNAVLEENFHAFQLDNKSSFYPNVSTSNIEFEAKVFNTMALNEAGLLMPVQGGTEQFTDFMQNQYDFNNPTSTQMQSSEFQTQYATGVQQFVDYWKQAVPDPKIFPGYKKTPSADGPNAVIKVQQEVESSGMVGPRLENGDFYSK